MKNLILILISCLAFSQEPQKPDTAKLSEEVKTAIVKAEVEKQKADILDKKLSEAEKENEKLKNKRTSLYAKLKHLFHEYFGPEEDEINSGIESKAIKEENRTDPVTEIDVPVGVDTIRGGWIYRLLHRNDYYFKRYKIENNEKVYLD